MEQQSIARILGALDDKIELNRQMNETLEAMARALFTELVRGFEPVRAKAAEPQQPPRASKPENSFLCFPTPSKKSELGEIPKGWEARPTWRQPRWIHRSYGKALYCRARVDSNEQGAVPVTTGQPESSVVLA